MGRQTKRFWHPLHCLAGGRAGWLAWGGPKTSNTTTAPVCLAGWRASWTGHPALNTRPGQHACSQPPAVLVQLHSRYLSRCSGCALVSILQPARMQRCRLVGRDAKPRCYTGRDADGKAWTGGHGQTWHGNGSVQRLGCHVPTSAHQPAKTQRRLPTRPASPLSTCTVPTWRIPGASSRHSRTSSRSAHLPPRPA